MLKTIFPEGNVRGIHFSLTFVASTQTNSRVTMEKLGIILIRYNATLLIKNE